MKNEMMPLEFYDEYIADAGLRPEQRLKKRLGTPRQLSHKILADYSIKANNESIKKDILLRLILVGVSFGGC